MTAEQKYTYWLTSPKLDQVSKKELLAIKGSTSEITKRFGELLDFGTGGVRALMGAGISYINDYTIRQVTTALANYLQDKFLSQKLAVVIAYDGRHNSHRFAKVTAHTLWHKNIQAFLFPTPAPTPLLSFAVRKMQAAAGVVITASHNPPAYNGYKVYDEAGVQITPDIATKIKNLLQKIPLKLEAINLADLTFSIVDDKITAAYKTHLKSLLKFSNLIKKHADTLNILYTPLHGVGGTCVPSLLRSVGFSQVHCPENQMPLDPNFSTVTTPNPEDLAAYTLAVQEATKQQCDLILANDPDADRLGVMTRNAAGTYQLLSGNQVGALLVNYLLAHGVQPTDKKKTNYIVKTIVSSELGAKIAAKYGVKTINTLTGFKYIGAQIKLLQEQFLFGYEESGGYLASTAVRDKDGVMAALLVAEMTLYYKLKNKTLLQVLDELYQEHGYFEESLLTWSITETDGLSKIKDLLTALCTSPPAKIGPFILKELHDYKTQKLHLLLENKIAPLKLQLPNDNTLAYIFKNNERLLIRPSGTEPKLKAYLSLYCTEKKLAIEQLQLFKTSFISFMQEKGFYM
jgi:phosphoglucomutase